MAYIFNPFTGKFDYYTSDTLASVLARGNTTSGYDIAFNTNGDVITDGTNISIDPYNRKIYASNGTTIQANYATASAISLAGAGTPVSYSIFVGNNSGRNASSATYSNFIGSGAGDNATNANSSSFIGNNAGNWATYANNSNFIGDGAGVGATYASYSNFLGRYAGSSATFASKSNFFGLYAGFGQIAASYSIFIGSNAGNNAGLEGQTDFANNLIIDQSLLGSGARASAAAIRTNALLYGTFASSASGQQLTINGTLNLGTDSPIKDGTNTSIDAYNRILKDASGNNTFTYSSSTAPQLNGLTTNGFVKTSSSNGTLTIDTNTYLTTETDPLSLHLATPNQTVTQTPTFDAGILLTEQADPSNPDATHGIIYTSDTNGKTNLNMLTNDGLKMRIGRDLISTVRNTSGSTIAAGKIVYQTGSTGTAPNVALAKADSENTLPAIGITMESISNNGYGRIQRFGRTEFSLDTNAYTEGDRLWVSATTAGEFTNVKPTHPNHPQPIGQVVVKGTGNGSIFTSFTSWYNEEFDGTVKDTFTFGATTATSQILAKTATAQRTATFPDKSGTVAFISDIVGDYAKLDGTNQPFTGDVNVSKTSPAYYLTSGADDAELKKVTSSRELTLKNDVGTPAGNPYAISTTAGAYPNQQYITLSNSVNLTTVGTVSLWFKRTGTGQGVFNSTGTGTKYIRATYTGTTLTATFYDGTTKSITHNFSDSLWHNLTVTFNTGSTGAKMYLDGASVGTPLGSWTFTKSDTTAFWLGSTNIYGGSSENWTGVFDEAGVWSRELTAGEVSDIYNSGNGLYLDPANNFPSSGTPISTNLLAIHHMNEGTGNAVNDSSGNGYNGTKTASASWVTGEKAIAPASSQQSTVISSKDGTLAGEKGIHTFGDASGRTVLDGLTIRFNVGGSEKGQLSTTMAWTLPNTITGSSDAVQDKVIANATQTNDLVQWLASNGSTKYWSISGTGVLTANATNIATDTSTGTKIGTATSQKFGFWNATPIIQPVNTTAIDTLLVNTGLRASGAYANFDTTLKPRTGSTSANTAPIKLTSGSLLTTSEAGAMEFLTDDLYFTRSTGAGGSFDFYPPAYNSTYVKATTEIGADRAAYQATNPANSLIGTTVNTSWQSTADTNQRFHIDLGTAKVVTRVYYENYHYYGSYINGGAKNFTLWGSNDASSFSTLTYGTDTGWTQLTTSISQLVQHSGSDAPDPQYFTVTNTTGYRYYAFKFADNWGGVGAMGIRRIILQNPSQPNGRGKIVVSNLEAGLTTGRIPYTTTGGFLVDSANLTYDGTTLTLGDANNIAVNTTTGTKIGTATSQKLGFYNAIPIVQPLATTDLGTVLSNLGLRAVGTAYPITTSGAINFTGGLTVATTGLTLTDVDIVLGTTTGTKIGTATSQKIGFFNATPIIQPINTTAIDTALINLGLWETGASYTPIDKVLLAKDAVYFTQTDGAEKIDSDADGDLDYYAGTSHDFIIGSTEQMTLTDGKLAPTTDSDIDLGDTTHAFKNVYGDAFITTGGTSSQFVKGDGSLDSSNFAAQINTLQDNLMLTNFRLQIASGLSYLNYEDSFIDEYEDETGVDTASSTNELYNSTDDYYSPTTSGLGTNLVGQWKMNDNAANTDVADSSGNNYTGTAAQNTSVLTTSGKINNALSFNGSSDRIITSANVSQGSTASYSFWIKTSSSTVDSWVLTFKASSGNVVDVIGLNMSNLSATDKIGFRKLQPGTGWLGTGIKSTTSVNDGTWKHIVATRNGANAKIYVNGTLEASTDAYSTASDASLPLLLGAYTDNGGSTYALHIAGDLDDVRIYSRELQQTDVDDLYNSGSGTESITNTASNMTLISNAITAEVAPTSSRIVLLEEDVDSITLNTDLKAYVSRDGTNYTQITLTDEGDFATSKKILVGEVNFTSASGTSIKYKIETLNNKNLKIHGTGVLWE
jgi:hypothetical protein